MLPKNLFKKPMNTLENAYEKLTKTAAPDVPSEMCTSCPECRAMLFSSDLSENNNVCPKCGHHFRINARQRISMIADEGTFQELYPITIKSSSMPIWTAPKGKAWSAALPRWAAGPAACLSWSPIS